MLEICLNDSAKGGLYEAQRRATEQHADSLRGTRENLAGLSFDFSCGDIRAPLVPGDCPRKRLLFQQFGRNPMGDSDDTPGWMEQAWQSNMADLEKVKQAAVLGAPVRIWTDFTPAAACGLLFVADLLKDASCKVTEVPLPRKWPQPDGKVVTFCGWYEVDPELFSLFLTGETPVTAKRLQLLARQWRSLQMENAPLRVLKNGTVMSAPEDYYDGVIRGELLDAPCPVALLIGRVLGRHQLGVSDWLIAQRIRVLIANGELAVCQEDPKAFYKTLIMRK